MFYMRNYYYQNSYPFKYWWHALLSIQTPLFCALVRDYSRNTLIGQEEANKCIKYNEVRFLRLSILLKMAKRVLYFARFNSVNYIVYSSTNENCFEETNTAEKKGILECQIFKSNTNPLNEYSSPALSTIFNNDSKVDHSRSIYCSNSSLNQ